MESEPESRCIYRLVGVEQLPPGKMFVRVLA